MSCKKEKFKLPHVYILLMIVMLIVVVLSKIVPSGEFAQVKDLNTGRMVIDPSDFKFISKSNSITVMKFFTSIHDGIVQSGDIIFNLLIVSGVIYMIEESGAIAAGIHKILDKSEGKELIVVAILTLIFAVLGAIGFGEGGLPFVPLAMTVVMALGYDRIAGFATAMLGMGVGFASGVLNLYTTGISQSIVGLPMFSGIGFRSIALVIFYVITVTYICIYCKKIKKDSSKSIVSREYINQDVNEITGDKVFLDKKRSIVLFVLAILFIVQAYGASRLNWTLGNISAIYIMFAIFIVILFRQNPSKACVTFSIGVSRLVPAALTIGLARSVMILMNESKIVDTAIYNLANMLNGKSSFVVLLMVYVAIIVFNFFVVSGSGKAVMLMPILGPLGQILKINQQIMVLVYQYGDGFTNYFWPTSGGLMAGLEMCNIQWQDWARFSWKIILILSTVAFGLVLFANSINLGPF